ncbi:hypothetical protein KC334_g20489, partial [Hortaea werneckii]
IKTTAPTRKLPALYVLDSIIKNVGTPYTVYLGRNLFSTFMEAYRLVDQGTRRAMDGLLKTWKEPVPGSLDTRPVFPPEAVRPIENAMIQLRTALQKQRQGQPQLAGHRNTPTPPQFNGQFGPPLHHQQMYYGHPSQQPTPQQHAFQQMYPQPSSTPQQYPLPHTPVQSPPVDVQTLKSDISSLLERVKAKFATSPYDKEIQTQLNAVIQLKQIVESGMVPAQQLHQVRDTVSVATARPVTSSPANVDSSNASLRDFTMATTCTFSAAIPAGTDACAVRTTASLTFSSTFNISTWRIEWFAGPTC